MVFTREILLIASVFLFFVCLIYPPFPALRNKSKSRIHSLNSGSAQDYLVRGDSHFRYGKYDLAIADYKQAIQIDPKYIQAYFNLAYIYAEQEKHDLAIINYNQAIEIDSNNINAYYNRGKYYFENQKYNLAIADFNQIIKIDANDINAYYKSRYFI